MHVPRTALRCVDDIAQRLVCICRPLLLGSVVLALGCGIILVSSHADAQQVWYASYTNALEAIKKQQWPEAERLLREAKRTGPMPGRRVLFYGSRREDFLPDYYLAMVLLRQNKADEARQLLDAVVRSNLIRNS